MFFFKKPTYKLNELIPSGFVDIHSHLLFGIDDGAKSFEETLEFTSNLIEFGFAEFITTPHTMQYVWENTKEGITNKKLETATLLRENNIAIPFEAASEYLIDESLVKRLQSESLLTIKDEYVLVEMSYLNPPIQLYDIIFELQVNGYKPILAHPERYLFFHNNLQEYDKLKKAGCLFQMNLLSSVGYYGENVLSVCNKLLLKGLYDFVGSDVHHSNHIKSFDNKVRIKDILVLQEIIANNTFFKS